MYSKIKPIIKTQFSKIRLFSCATENGAKPAGSLILLMPLFVIEKLLSALFPWLYHIKIDNRDIKTAIYMLQLIFI